MDFKARLGKDAALPAMDEDIEKILLSAGDIQRRVEEIAARIAEDYRGKELTIVAVLDGALIFTADLLRRIPLPVKLDCVSVASYYGGTESSGEVRFDQLSLPDIAGRHVLIVDDILDSGLTLDAITAKLQRECSPLSTRICVLLSKQKTRRKETVAHYVGFEIVDEFVVGYGLDYQGRYRNLPHVAVLKEDVVRFGNFVSGSSGV
jgi:hypoxanthine phosphoribosyltransferase